MFYRRPRTRLSRHPDFVLATSLKHRYRSDIHRFLSIFFFYQPIFVLFFHSTSLSNPVSTGLASFFSSKIHDTTYLIDDRFHRRSTSKLHCSTRHVATTDRFRNEETSGRNCDARAIDKRIFFLNCPTIISIPCTRLKRSHEVTNHYRVARFSPLRFILPHFDLFLLFLFFSFLPSPPLSLNRHSGR